MKKNATIDSLSWGVISCQGKSYRDMRICGEDVSVWDWKESDVHHDPGITMKAVKDLIDNGCEIILLTTGFDNKLLVSDKVKEMVSGQVQAFYVVNTSLSLEVYNSLLESGLKIGALIHSTC